MKVSVTFFYIYTFVCTQFYQFKLICFPISTITLICIKLFALTDMRINFYKSRNLIFMKTFFAEIEDKEKESKVPEESFNKRRNKNNR